MPTTRRSITDPSEEIKTKLDLLQRKYDKCQIKLEKVLQENADLKEQILHLKKNKKGGENSKISSSVRRSYRRPRKDYTEEIDCSDKENSEDEEEIEEEDQPIKLENIMDDDYDYDDMKLEGYDDGSPLSPPNSDDINSDELSSNNEEIVVKTSKSKRKGNKCNIKIGKTKRRKPVVEKLAPSTELQTHIVNFLDAIISTRQRAGRPRSDSEDISLYDINGLDKFDVILGKKLDSFLRDEMNKMAIHCGVVPPKVPKHVVEYFSAPPPSADPYIKAHFQPKKQAVSKPQEDNGDNLPIRRKRRNKGDSDLPPAFKPTHCSTFIEGQEDVPTICEVCGVSCGTLTKLKRHMISHDPPKHPCPVCGKLFKRKDDIKKHIKAVHDKVYRFQCTMCPKQFTDPSGFRRHERVHLMIKNHQCSICGKRLAELKNLRLHMATQHNGNELPHRVKIVV